MLLTVHVAELSELLLMLLNCLAVNHLVDDLSLLLSCLIENCVIAELSGVPQSDLSLHAVTPSRPKIPTIPSAHVTRPETPKTLSYPTRTNSKQNTAHTLPALASLKWESPSYPVP